MSTDQLWFRSTLFEIETGEDEETNPFLFGRQLARWLREQLLGLVFGHPTQAVHAFCGVRNVHNYAVTRPTDPLPQGAEVVWSCAVIAEQSIFGRLFHRVNMEPAAAALFSQVKTIIESEPSNTLVPEP